MPITIYGSDPINDYDLTTKKFVDAAARLGLTRTGVSDVAYVITGTTNQWIGYTALTAARVVTLPAATFAGQMIYIGDEAGVCTASLTLTVTAAGTDTINGSATNVINRAYGYRGYISNGAGKWTVFANTLADITAVDAKTLNNLAPAHYDCSGACTWTCYSGCVGSCNNSCTGACHSTCTTGCGTACGTGCANTCTGACTGCSTTCTSGCSTSCSGVDN